MSTLKIVLKKTNENYRINEQGHALIYIQYGHNSKTTLFSTGIRVDPNHWQGQKNQNNPISRGQKGYSSNNAVVNKKKLKIEEIKNHLILQDVEATIYAVREIYMGFKGDNARLKDDLLPLFETFMQESRTTKASSTVMKYKTCRNHLTIFIQSKGMKLAPDAVTVEFYDRFVKYLLTDAGLVNNSTGTVIKHLKVFFSFLKKKGYKFNVDFKDFKVFAEKSNIVYLTQEELKHLWEYKFESQRLERVRDLFLLIASTGLRYSDLSRLGSEHLEGNTIKMMAHKTKTRVTIPLTPISSAILKKYDYKLPRLTGQRFNNYIKEACKVAGVDAPTEKVTYRGGQKHYTKRPKHEFITSHKAVNSFITHCCERGISPKVVAQITGKTVQVILDQYLGIDESTIQREMNRAFGGPDMTVL